MPAPRVLQRGGRALPVELERGGGRQRGGPAEARAPLAPRATKGHWDGRRSVRGRLLLVLLLLSLVLEAAAPLALVLVGPAEQRVLPRGGRGEEVGWVLLPVGRRCQVRRQGRDAGGAVAAAGGGCGVGAREDVLLLLLLLLLLLVAAEGLGIGWLISGGSNVSQSVTQSVRQSASRTEEEYARDAGQEGLTCASPLGCGGAEAGGGTPA